MTRAQVKGLMGGVSRDKEPVQTHVSEIYPEMESNSAPETFDSREIWPSCGSIKEIRDQANCGSCWAFAAAETMSDRICIKSSQKLQTRISPQDITSCCFSCGGGCGGNFPNFIANKLFDPVLTQARWITSQRLECFQIDRFRHWRSLRR
jgi:cathepsin B